MDHPIADIVHNSELLDIKIIDGQINAGWTMADIKTRDNTKHYH